MIRRTYSVGSDTRNGGSSAPSLSPTTVVTPAQTSNFVGRRRSASESGGEWRVAIRAPHRRQTSPALWTLVPLPSSLFFRFRSLPLLLFRSSSPFSSRPWQYFEVAVENEKYTWSVLKSERQFEDLQAVVCSRAASFVVRFVQLNVRCTVSEGRRKAKSAKVCTRGQHLHAGLRSARPLLRGDQVRFFLSTRAPYTHTC